MAQPNISINYSTGIDHDFFMQLSTFRRKERYAEFVFVWVFSVIEIPVMILTLIALFSLIKSRPAASVFVSHLIFSDLIQVICMLIGGTTSWTVDHLDTGYFYSLIVGLYFMACVAFERYLLVSHPIWYKSHHSLKLSCFISLIIWFVPLTFAKIDAPRMYFEMTRLCIACLIPYPIIILCFAGTWRGLSHSKSLTYLKRKLILGSLFLVLLTYTFLILPFLIMVFMNYITLYSFLSNKSLVLARAYQYADLLMYVNPLADCLLYLFMRPDVGDMLKSVHCCCRNHNQDKQSVVNPQTSCTTVCFAAQKPSSHSLNTCSSV